MEWGVKAEKGERWYSGENILNYISLRDLHVFCMVFHHQGSKIIYKSRLSIFM